MSLTNENVVFTPTYVFETVGGPSYVQSTTPIESTPPTESDVSVLFNESVDISHGDVVASHISIENTSSARKYIFQVIGSSLPTRSGNLEIVVGGATVISLTPNGKFIFSGSNSADPNAIEVPSSSTQYGGSGVLGKVLFGHTPVVTLNRPDPTFNMHTRAYTVDLNGQVVNGIATQTVFFDQVILRNGYGVGSTGDLYFTANWKDYTIEAGGGDNLVAFGSGMENVTSFSNDFTGILFGREYDTNVNPTVATSNPYIAGVISIAGVNTGPGTVSDFVTGFWGIGMQRGTANVAHAMGLRGNVQFGDYPPDGAGTIGNASMFWTDGITLAPESTVFGNLTGDLVSYRAERGTFPQANVTGKIYAFYAAAPAGAYKGPDVFNSKFGGGNWDNGHILLGDNHLWIEAATGKLRVKASAPTSDSDGTVVGTQA